MQSVLLQLKASFCRLQSHLMTEPSYFVSLHNQHMVFLIISLMSPFPGLSLLVKLITLLRHLFSHVLIFLSCTMAGLTFVTKSWYNQNYKHFTEFFLIIFQNSHLLTLPAIYQYLLQQGRITSEAHIVNSIFQQLKLSQAVQLSLYSDRNVCTC